jgi:hypothetical protein
MPEESNFKKQIKWGQNNFPCPIEGCKYSQLTIHSHLHPIVEEQKENE